MTPTYQRFTCPQCGHSHLSQTATCPQCGGFAKSQGEYTKKTNDEPDLKKAW